ncbi:hypothetical protein QFC22_000300 [Naganishia vaughanmartiniae]|uniref:Uncharacterized protein n=1 Tax=Naganishia vaughanmartiniae TaxID=1424756 RepID=A0ACC2XPQ4_9TREE|nr:hypothetical protein QFC22_000300 [Naganishia vaughanmartiniae]
MSFPQQDSLNEGGLEDDVNQSFDASSYINDDGDSPEPFNSLDPESDAGVHDIMGNIEGTTNINQFLGHSNDHSGVITFIPEPHEDTAFGTRLSANMDASDARNLDENYGMGTVSMEAVGSRRIGNTDMYHEGSESPSTADITPRASKISGKSGMRSMDQQRYAAAMQQHHHVNGNTPFTGSAHLPKAGDVTSPRFPSTALSRPPKEAGEFAESQSLHASSSVTPSEMQDRRIFSPANFDRSPVKREPDEDASQTFGNPGTTASTPLQIQLFEQFEAETGQEDDEEDTPLTGSQRIPVAQLGTTGAERSSDSSAPPEGRQGKRSDKGKGKDSSSGLEGDETEAGANAEMDAMGDADGDDENARRKIKIEYIEDKSRRHITFSKRKAGIMKKAYELSILTGTQVLLLVVSETGLCYTYTTPKMSPMVTQPAGQQLIQACLNAPEGFGPDGEVLKVPSAPTGSKKDKSELAIRPLKLNAEELANLAAASASASDPTTPKKKKQGKPTLDGKDGKPGGAGAAQSRRRASEKVKRAASGAAKKGSRVTSEGGMASSSNRLYADHDMDVHQQPPPVPALPPNVQRMASNYNPTNSANGTNTVMLHHNTQPEIQPGVSLVSPISSAFPMSHRLPAPPPPHHLQQHQSQPNDYPEYGQQVPGNGSHYYQAQSISIPHNQQPPPGSMVPVINYSYPTQAPHFMNSSPANNHQMQRRQSQHQSQSPHVSHPHQHYTQNMQDSRPFDPNAPHPSQMLAGPIGMSGQM